MRRFLYYFFSALWLIFKINNVNGQAPVISYSPSTNVYTVGVAIATLTPTNSGGAVPAATYAQVTTPVAVGAGLKNPRSIASDGAGNVYFADFGNNRIRKVTAAGVVSTLAGSGAAAELDGTGAAAKFNGPYGIAYDGGGNLYVSDRTGDVIRKIVIATGVVTTYAGIANTAGSTNLTLLTSKFKSPAGLTVDASGNIYVADLGNNLIRKLSGNTVTTLAGSGVAGAANGTGVLASFNGPNDLVADASGNLFVADELNSLLRKIVINTGVVTTFAGSAAGYIDATGVAAKFNKLSGISIDALDNLYVADLSNERIRLVTPAGVVTTIAGSGANAEADGTNIAASFGKPAGIDVDGLGNCYIVDDPTGTTGTVRKMSIVGYSINAAPPAGLVFDPLAGSISGTPTAATAATNYTITGYNLSGSSSTVISIAVGVAVAWTGASNTAAWATPGNWSTGAAPGINDAVSIGVSAYTKPIEPAITAANVTVGSITFGNNGGNHTLTVTSPTTLTISSYLTVNTGVTPTITGTGAVNISPATIVNITGTGVLNTTLTGKFTLKSDATGSASIGQITTTSITGTGADSIHVERYVTGGAGYRGYRLLSSPVYTASVAGNNVCDLHYLFNNIYITGAAGGGFNKTGNPTIYLFREDQAVNNQTFTTGNFWGISKMNNAVAYNYFTNGGSTPTYISVGNGYIVFFRGDRSAANVNTETVAGYVPVAATLSAYGILNAGQIIVHDWYTQGSANLGWTNLATNGPVRGFNLVGNPYASSIDWEQYSTTLPNTNGIYTSNVGNTIYELNPLTGNYDSYQVGGAFTNHGSRTIVSGQAFYVVATSAAAQLIFNESAKASAPFMQNTGLNLLMADKATVTNLNNAPADQHLRLQLAEDAVNADDIYIRFNSAAKTQYVYNEDSPYKPGSGLVSLVSLSSDNVPLAINTLPLPKQSETINLAIGASADGTYKLNKLDMKGIPELYDVWLIDAYKKDSLDLRHNNTYTFDILKSDTNSYGAKRFNLVIRQNSAKAFHLISFTAAKSTNGVQTVWKTENEQNYTNFTVERSTDNGKTFDVLGGFWSTADGTYSFLDRNPLRNATDQYRLKLEDLAGTISYSKVVALQYSSLNDNDANKISIYPNPTSGIVNLSIAGPYNPSSKSLFVAQELNTQAGTNNNQSNSQSYEIRIMNITGILVRTAKSSQHSWRDNLSSLSPGTYIIQVLNSSDRSVVGKGTFVKL